MSVPSQESERSICICLSGLSFLSVSTICRLACVTVPTVWYLMFLSFYDLSTSLCNCSDSVVSNVFDFINEN